MTEVKQCWARLVLGWEATSYCTMCQPNLSACSAGFAGSADSARSAGLASSAGLARWASLAHSAGLASLARSAGSASLAGLAYSACSAALAGSARSAGSARLAGCLFGPFGRFGPFSHLGRIGPINIRGLSDTVTYCFLWLFSWFPFRNALFYTDAISDTVTTILDTVTVFHPNMG